MNPFVAFLILVPLLISLIAVLAVTAILLEKGPSSGLLLTLAIFLSISGALGFLLKRTSRSPFIEFPGSDRLDEGTQRQLTTFFVSVIFVTLTLIALLFINLSSMRNWLGGLSVLLALLMVCSSVHHMRQTRRGPLSGLGQTTGQEIERGGLLVSATTVARNLFPASLILMGVSVLVLYWGFGGDRYLSVLDVGGLLLLGFALWLWTVSMRPR